MNFEVVPVEHTHVPAEALHPHRGARRRNHQVEEFVRVFEATLGLAHQSPAEPLCEFGERSLEVRGQLPGVSTGRPAGHTVALDEQHASRTLAQEEERRREFPRSRRRRSRHRQSRRRRAAAAGRPARTGRSTANGSADPSRRARRPTAPPGPRCQSSSLPRGAPSPWQLSQVAQLRASKKETATQKKDSHQYEAWPAQRPLLG